MLWLFVGPTPLSGIGQTMLKYSRMKNTDYIQFGQPKPDKEYTDIFMFILPLQQYVDYAKTFTERVHVMTICETDPVHEDYKRIFDNFENVFTPSIFCKNIFDKQFNTNVKFLPLWTDVIHSTPYTFYTIGNIIDPRKNINMLIEAYVRCNFPKGSTRLVLKATCVKDVSIKLPGVSVINGLVSEEEMDRIHKDCDCYINCSHSEGVGMGAVEAALRNKPVIITDYGGLKEYVNTPFTVHCVETESGIADFLFQPHMKWGVPSIEELISHMKTCYENQIRYWDHTHTKNFIKQAETFFTEDASSKTSQP